MATSLAGKSIVFGITGSIAAFKVAGWVSSLAQDEALVDVIMSDAAQRFITPLTFSSLTGRKIYTRMFPADGEPEMSHISLGREAECIIIAPATANTIAKLAYGLADELISTTVLASRCPIIVCPAMNVQMFENPVTQQNIRRLREHGYLVIEPDDGMMACGDYGKGRLPEWEVVREYLLRSVSEPDLTGQKVLVTAGPTQEPYDPARFISNRSSGKMGYAIAQEAFHRGADVLLISGPSSLSPPPGIRLIKVKTAAQMYDAVFAEYQDKSVIIKAAAVSDFRCEEIHQEKVKKDGLKPVIKLVKNKDILLEIGSVRDRQKQLLIGFAAESSNIEKEGLRKLKKKQLDLIAINDIVGENRGFEADSNQLLLIDTEGRKKLLPHESKVRTAEILWDYIVENGYLK